jgi:hypothetical protein
MQRQRHFTPEEIQNGKIVMGEDGKKHFQPFDAVPVATP